MADQRLPPSIVVMNPPDKPGASSLSVAHPRRPPAHRSVSLLHSARRHPVGAKVVAKDRSDSSSDGAARAVANESGSRSRESGSPSSLLPLGRDSSGESSNADKWFEKSNNEVRDNSAPFADEPPFFMRNSSSSETPPDVQRQMLNAREETNSLPLRASLLQLGTDGSSTEDFRSVIDDLTIENKKLKRRLKKYEKLHDSHLRDEKLFEVRIHGLPPEKKRELEETLRKFASSLGTTGFPANGYEGLLPILNKFNTASSQTSVQNTDSAYASLSASGQGSSAQSGNETRYKHLGATAASRRQNIHSFLHHIPEGLLPQFSPANMTERAKKKLVVRRLEQIFAGRGAAVGGHQHSLQQQDVSQMAARADRAASEALGQRTRQEGTREAHIMLSHDEDATDPANRDDNTTSPDDDSPPNAPEPSAPSAEARTATAGHENEQRPTRPLDLDLHRAQVPAENYRYMRHLGFSPLDAESQRSPQEGHGWIYLNLLINMAQLHTINVTVEFVRKALTEMSSKFEISLDGRKVRWRGGRSVTRASSSGGHSSNSRAGIDTPDGQSPRKRPKLTHRGSGRSGASNAQQGGASGLRHPAPENNKLVYTPLFFHKDSTDDAEDSSDEDYESTSSPYPAPAAGDSSGMTSSGMRTTSTKKHDRHDDGPIIFYNNARFCTDLSGERKPLSNVNAPPYTPVTAEPLGQPKRPAEPTYEKRGPLAEAFELPEPMDLGDNPIPESMELSFPKRSPLQSERSVVARPMPFEVTGIGGVWPADNFSISVESRHARVDDESAPSTRHDLPSQRVPHKFAQVIREANPQRVTRGAVHKRIVRANKYELPPSQLPPALSFMPSEDSYGDDESEGDDEMSVSPESPGAVLPSAAPQPVEVPHDSSEDEDEDDDDDDDESDGSLDLLAVAREVDPDAIREKEREYDANMAERLAEEIPAGSSAATAGGGSGFASPASAVDAKEYQRAVQESVRKRPEMLKRAETSDSMKVKASRQSSSDDDDDDDDDDSDEDEDEDMDDVAS